MVRELNKKQYSVGASVKDGNGIGKWKMEMELENGNGKIVILAHSLSGQPLLLRLPCETTKRRPWSPLLQGPLHGYMQVTDL